MTTVAVIGGGAIGLTAALSLASRDVHVTLFEKDQLGNGASGRAAGICYDAYAQQRDARIAGDSLEQFRERGMITECPYVWFARSADDIAAAIESQANRMAATGRAVSVVDPDIVAKRFPGLVTADMATAAIAENAGYVDTDSYIELLATEARREGVHIRTGTEARVSAAGTVSVDDGGNSHSFDAILVAAGAGTRSVLGDTSIDLALALYRTQALVAEPATAVPIFYDASQEWYARPTTAGLLAGDGSHMYDGDPATYRRDADEQFRTDRLDALEHRLHGRVTVQRSWAGLCTATPDRDPLLGHCTDDIYVATGLCGHGFMRSPVLGNAIADQILGGDGIPAFDPNRFDGDESIELPIGITE